MIIDSHTHIGLESFNPADLESTLQGRLALEDHLENTVEGLLFQMEVNNVDRSVAFPFPLPGIDVALANRYVLESAQYAEGKVIPFGLIDENISSWIDHGIRGFKHHSGLLQQETFLPKFYQQIQDAEIPLIIHVSRRFGSFEEQILRIQKIAPHIQLIIAHMGRWVPNTGEGVSDNLDAKINWDAVYFETSTVRNSQAVELAVHRLGAEKIIFGSDAPFNSCINTNPLGEELKVINESDLTDLQRRMILGDNIAQLLKLDIEGADKPNLTIANAGIITNYSPLLEV